MKTDPARAECPEKVAAVPLPADRVDLAPERAFLPSKMPRTAASATKMSTGIGMPSAVPRPKTPNHVAFWLADVHCSARPTACSASGPWIAESMPRVTIREF